MLYTKTLVAMYLDTINHFDKLPDEALLNVFFFLKHGEIAASSLVCKRFFQLANDPYICARKLKDAGLGEIVSARIKRPQYLKTIALHKVEGTVMKKYDNITHKFLTVLLIFFASLCLVLQYFPCTMFDSRRNYTKFHSCWVGPPVVCEAFYVQFKGFGCFALKALSTALLTSFIIYLFTAMRAPVKSVAASLASRKFKVN